MSLLRQVALLPAGCQAWSKNVLEASSSHFFYAATLAVYAHSLEDAPLYSLQKLFAGHQRTITSIALCPANPRLLVSTGLDGDVLTWDLQEERELRRVPLTEHATRAAWCAHDPSVVALVANGDILLMEPTNASAKTERAPGTPENVTAVQWNYNNGGSQAKLAVGTKDGHVHIWSLQTKKAVRIACPDATRNQAIVDLQWDPLSNVYLIATYASGHMTLIDTEANAVSTEFEQQGPHGSIACFLPFMPGMFATVSVRSAIIALWNVSNRAPMELIKMPNKTAGVICMRHVPQSQNVILGFRDGSVCLFDFVRRRTLFASEPAHSETIFDCRFKPGNPHILATASYDGACKLWDVESMRCVGEMAGQEGVLYGLAWAPGDNDNRLVTVSSKGEAHIWNSETGQLLRRLNNHTRASYRVAWSAANPSRIASTGDNTCVVFTPEGQVLRTLKHPDLVFGVDWHPTKQDVLCTGCQDGAVRVFDLSNDSDNALTLKAHTSRVFNTVWSPLCPELLASGSDDKTIRVWDTSGARDAVTLAGHSHNVRAMAWSPEVPFLLLSGSWDGTIRLWDVRSGQCLQTVFDHHADVYGLHCHPLRPFLFVSSSRDTTLRMWSAERLVAPAALKAVCEGGLNASALGIAAAELKSRPPSTAAVKLCGHGSRALAALPAGSSHKAVCSFFYALPGVRDLWALVDAVAQGKPSPANALIPHINDLRDIARSRAKLLEMQRGIGRKARAEKLRVAAQLHMKMGNVREYCEMLAEAEDWERALAAAPAVGMDFWKALAARYAQALAQRADPEAYVYEVLGGEHSKAIESLETQGAFDDALLVAVSSALAKFPNTGAAVDARKPLEEERARVPVTPAIAGVLRGRAAKLYAQAQPVAAACCALAMSDTQVAVRYLLRGSEGPLAYAVSRVLNAQSDEARLTMAGLCERSGLYIDALLLLRQCSDSSARVQMYMGRVYSVTQSDKDFCSLAAFRLQSSYREQAESALQRGGDVPEILRLFVLAGDHERAVEVGLTAARTLLSAPQWTPEALSTVLAPLESVDMDALSPLTRTMLLAYLMLLGFHKAVARDYEPIVSFFASALRRLTEKTSAPFPVARDVLRLQEAAYYATRNPYRAQQLASELISPSGFASDAVKEAAKRVLEQAVAVQPAREAAGSAGTLLVPTASTLPTGLRQRFPALSLLSGRVVSGARVILDDGASVVSAGEAAMWAECCAFSPLLSGRRFVL